MSIRTQYLNNNNPDDIGFVIVVEWNNEFGCILDNFVFFEKEDAISVVDELIADDGKNVGEYVYQIIPLWSKRKK